MKAIVSMARVELLISACRGARGNISIVSKFVLSPPPRGDEYLSLSDCHRLSGKDRPLS